VGGILLVLGTVPLASALVCLWSSPLAGRSVTLLSGAVTFAGVLTLVPSGTTVALSGWLRVDALSEVFLGAVAFVYLATALFVLGYVRPEASSRHRRRFLAGFNLFAWAMVMAPLVNSLALLWVAVEITTVVSALLVAIDGTDAAAEAAWKYLLIASIGLGLALLATVVLYQAGTSVLGSSYQASVPMLLRSASHFPATAVRLSVVLAVLGYGTKMGLVPVHTWLPDAHAEAPTPVSALLSGALLAVSFYAILRFYQISVRAIGPAFGREVLLGFGVASLGLGALLLASQRDLKRLLAYSSVEHMGMLAIGTSFSAPIATVGVLLHVLAHAAAKGTAFFGAGSVQQKFGSKDLASMQGAASVLPWTGPMLMAAVLGLSALPPFGIFRSELFIVEGGLRTGSDTVAALVVVLVTLATLALSWFIGRTVLDDAPVGVRRGESSAWMAASMLLGLGALVVLGVHPPAALSHLLARAATELR